MAAIDPSAIPEREDAKEPLRATLKLIRVNDEEIGDSDDEGDEDFDEDEIKALIGDGDEESSSGEEMNGGPSDPAKTKKARQEAAAKKLNKQLEEDAMEMDLANGVNGSSKGKGKGKVLSEDDEDSELDDEDVEEFVICTLDPSKNYQQALDLTINEDERIFFKVSGTHTVYLSGNYVAPAEGHQHLNDDYDSEDDDELDYDLSPDEDELDDSEQDELDDILDARITEIESEEEAPALIKADKKDDKKTDKKGKNKRAAEDSAEEGASTLDDQIDKSVKSAKDAAATNGEQKLSKKQLKKLKNNAGQAIPAAGTDNAESAKKDDGPSSAKSDKKVSFAKELEQGPTPTKAVAPAAEKPKDSKPKASLGAKTVQGVTIDDKKLGSGPAAKKGDRVGMRYIGKLQDGKVFDSNKKGKPFSFKLGGGDVIKGWDIGVAGMSVGGERRITVPAHLAYGSKAQAGIPANSTLVFDLKLLELK
ncbi:peptidylprolyl isomerase fpr3 [Elasticomyces elasticus]|nr:peptidylprolyl isomerase fpr3 [Elasticomyces elasticus]KAK4997349.1 peptidylprolyl isomerase fpr3 [Elasticomyces elasticus]